MKLVLLESPTKTRALQKFLGDDYAVLSCNGHIWKMTKTGRYKLGINWASYEPLYQPDKTKQSLLAKLKKYAKNADVLYLATDPDREGEAIAYHLSQSLPARLKHYRILFNEITKPAVLEAFKSPKALNLNLIAAQSARRVLDRMIGFRLSRLLQQKLFAKSAGRVQSVALHLLADKERLIQAFTPEEYWTAGFCLADYRFELQKWASKSVPLKNAVDVKALQNLVKNEPVQFVQERQRQKIVQPPAFLTTAKLLQLAASKLGFSVKKTTFLAQKLYEGIKIAADELIGFITYPRTDSIRVNQLFLTKSFHFLATTIYASQLRKTLQQPRQSSQNVQDAHEAIRITDWTMDLKRAQKYLENDEFKLYQLIYQQTQMVFLKPCQTFTHTVQLQIGKSFFQAQKEFIVEPGFQVINKQIATAANFQSWKEQKLTPITLKVARKETKPPNRLTEGELIRLMEQNGVGRPSTYNQMVDKLLTSLYVEKITKYLKVTSKGLEVDHLLQNHFSEIINEEYTAECENKFDEIASNPKIRQAFLANFWTQFNNKIQAKQKEISKPDPLLLDDQTCPQCQAKLLLRDGRYGQFISCQTYPRCDYKRPLKVQPPKFLASKCPLCDAYLVERKGKYGPFIGCSAYPKCAYLQKTPTDQKAAAKVKLLAHKCPRCQAQLNQRVGRYGPFISCSNYPKCRYRPSKSETKTLLQPSSKK